MEDLGGDGRIILKWIYKKRDGGPDWIAVALDRDRGEVVVIAVMDLLVP